MTAANQWETFYDRHAPFYDRGAFTHHTEAEIDFLLEVTGLAPGARILDVGCGTGRHAITLARRGYWLTGVDISAGMLLQAIARAREAGVDVDWVHADAGSFKPRELFDGVICLCGSAFTLADIAADPAEHDAAILRMVSAALRPAGPFVLTTPNGYRSIREVSAEDVASGRFDPLTMTRLHEVDFELGGFKERMRYRERLYIVPELTALMAAHGLAVEHVWGGTAGRWGRRPLEIDEVEVMIVARRVEPADGEA